MGSSLASSPPAKGVASALVLGSRVHLVSASRAVDQMEYWIEAKDAACKRITVTGFHGLLQADKSRAIHYILNSAELWVPDGIAPVLAARLAGHRGVKRATGTDLMLEFLRRANNRAYSSYFYGDTDETLHALLGRVKEDFPGHRIAGAFAPPFRELSQSEDDKIVRQINAAQPDVLWVALGMPKQETWIYERLDRLKVPVAIGVGAAFAFVAGTLSRCPGWAGDMGLEWAYRVLHEPRKLWRRVLVQGSEFVVRLGLETLGISKGNGNGRLEHP